MVIWSKGSSNSAYDNWNNLLDGNETKVAELTYEWQMTHWKHFHTDAKLFVLVVKEAGSIVAIAPLKLRRIGPPGIGVRRLEFIAAEESNYQDFIIGDKREEILERILDYLTNHRRLWDVLSVRHVPETSTTARFLLDRLDNRLLRRVETERCILLTLDKTWEEYAASSQKARKKIAYLAYPYGESNHKIRSMAMQAGYKAAFGVITGESGRYNLWRRPCGSRDAPLTFAFKLSRWCGHAIWLRRWLREATRTGRFLRRVKYGWFPNRA